MKFMKRWLGEKAAEPVAQPPVKAKPVMQPSTDPFDLPSPSVGNHAHRVLHSHGHSHSHGHTHAQKHPHPHKPAAENKAPKEGEEQ